MAKGTNLTVSWYDAEAIIRAYENADWDALGRALANLRVDFETATAA